MAILILETGEPVPAVKALHGRFGPMFERRLGVECELADALAGELPDGDYEGVVITGSPATVHERQPWSERAAAWIAERIDQQPMLGVCYGHQLMVHATGGRTGRNPRGEELGAVPVQRRDDPLFAGLPRHFLAWQVHFDAVLKPPPGTRVLAASARTPVQALAWPGGARSVQFHPEFDQAFVRDAIAQYGRVEPDLPPYTEGERVLRNWLTHFVAAGHRED
jgi:GMP synthase (glutamine-hydrolysing)